MNTYKKFFFAYLVLILLVSSIPGNTISKTWFSLGWEDKLYHMIEFSVLGILAYLAYYQELPNPFIYFDVHIAVLDYASLYPSSII